MRFDPIWGDEVGDKEPTAADIAKHARRSVFTPQWPVFNEIRQQIVKGDRPMMYSRAQAWGVDRKPTPWDNSEVPEIHREMLSLSKAYNVLSNSGYKNMFDRLWRNARWEKLVPFGKMIVGALRHFGKLPDDLTASEVAALRRERDGPRGRRGGRDEDEKPGWNLGCDMGGWFDLEAICHHLNHKDWKWPKPFGGVTITPAH
eukprot:1113270-Alexandrium_andersonii.AAC.1